MKTAFLKKSTLGVTFHVSWKTADHIKKNILFFFKNTSKLAFFTKYHFLWQVGSKYNETKFLKKNFLAINNYICGLQKKNVDFYDANIVGNIEENPKHFWKCSHFLTLIWNKSRFQKFSFQNTFKKTKKNSFQSSEKCFFVIRVA